MSLLPWIIAFLEGFSTLAVEVIAIRLAVPVVGSSIVLTGVMLGVVLLALSAGYWRGGALSARWDAGQTRRALARNLLIAAVLYGGVAFPWEATLIERLLDVGAPLPLAIGGAAVLLLLLPVYLASQTVPMLAEITDVDGHAGRASGKVLFFSTLGSVAGGVITPVWLFPAIGVAFTGYIVCAVLAIAALVIAWGNIRRTLAATAAALFIAAAISRSYTAPADLFHFDSPYQTIRVTESGKERVLTMGGSRSSGVDAITGATSFAYARAADKLIEDSHATSVLVIGAAGFTVPRDVAALTGVERIDAVDIDPAVRSIAERYFLRAPLSPKIRFLPLSARYAVRKLQRDGERYGIAFLDAYFARGIPEELVTAGFFQDVRQIAGRVAANVIMDADMDTAFAHNVLATFREAFGSAWIRDVNPGDDAYLANMMVTNWPAPGTERWTGTGIVYRDDKSSADRDHVQMMW